MKKILSAAALILFCGTLSFAQSKTTQALDDKFEGLSLYFYKNTLRMLNQKNDPDFDALIKDIEKMKFLLIDKGAAFGKSEYKKLLNDYKAEAFEPIMTSRYQGKNFDIYMKDKKGSSLGTVVLVNDSTSLYVLDIIGTIDVSKASSLFSTIDSSSDIGKQIKNFTNRKEKELENKH
ncbi:MAG: hypothetical protein DI538_01575 [Azospira oryzae]|jgi:hypothetical protein|nr:MAG: hypothetical protein DI538_01575 [Azospira oryzae]